MNRIYASYSTFLLLSLHSVIAFSQGSDCGNNAGFEAGSTAGWQCKYGSYGALTCPPASACPEYQPVYTNLTCLNTGGINAPLKSATDRHTIVTSAGTDPNSLSPFLIPVVAPGGGNYSFRLGNDTAGGINPGFTPNYAQAEAIRLTYNVTPLNAFFTYRYAAFLEKPLAAFHLPEAEPRFEIILFDSANVQVPCGYYKVVAGDWNGCTNTGNLHKGAWDGPHSAYYYYTDWTDVGLDLSGFIGHPVSIEFRTSDCFPSGGNGVLTTTIINGVTNSISTYTYPNGTVCTDTCDTQGNCTAISCTGPLPCTNNAAGYHNAYAYIDAYCSPVTIAAPNFCAGAPSLQICAPAGYASYIWPGVAGNPTTQCVTISNPVAGNSYTVNLVSVGGCPGSRIFNLLGVDAATKDTTLCAGGAGNVTLKVTPVNSGTYTYTWTGPSAYNSAQQNPVIPSPTVTSVYTVTVTDTSGCSVTKIMTVNINPKPPVTVSPIDSICVGSNSQLTSSGGTTCVWTPGATLNNPTSYNPVATPTTTTTYTVTVTDGNGCVSSTNTTVVVNLLPVVNTSPPQSICLGASATISASGGGTYIWSPSATLNSSTSASPLATSTTTTTYSVLVTDPNGCLGAGTSTVIVNPLPVVTADPNTTVCIGTSVVLTATGGTTYAWSPSSSLTNPNTANPTASPSVTTTYTVSVSDANGCTGKAVVTVSVVTLSVNVSPDASYCIGGSTQLTSSVTGATAYIWSPATGLNNPNLPNPIASPTTTTTYTLSASNAAGCFGIDTVTITVHPIPIVNVSPDANLCLGANTQLTATGGTSYVWTPPMTLNNASVFNPVATPPVTTTYSVTVTDANGCVNNGKTTINVYSISINVSPNTSYCLGSSTQISASGGVKYAWTPATGLSSDTVADPVASPTATTTYSVDVTNANGCKAKGNVTVVVLPLPSANAGPDQNICVGQSAQLNATGGTYYIWSPSPSLSSLVIPNPVATPAITSAYYVSVSNGNICPPAEDTVNVIVHPIPFVNAGSDTSIMAGNYVQLGATGNGISYQWLSGPTLSCLNCLNPVASPMKTTTYIITTVDAYGCKNTDTVIINVDDILTLYVPTAFTPYNYDNKNGVFYAYGVGIWEFEFYIFDRWGAMVFHTNDQYVGWDGTYNGRNVQSDVYVWLATAKSITGKSISKTGPVTVVH